MNDQTIAKSDPDKGNDEQKIEIEVRSAERRGFMQFRYIVMILALTSPFAVTYSKQQINIAILGMIDPSMSNETKVGTSDKLKQVADSKETYYFDLDDSCPVDDETRSRLLKESARKEPKSRALGSKFKWDDQVQGFIKASYSIGHLPLQVVGSRMSESHGSHVVMTASSYVMAICCLLAPIVSHLHYSLLALDLALLGLFGGFMTPALVNLFSNWLTPQEKSLFMSFYLVASRLGSALSSFLASWLLTVGYPWEYVFFSGAVICMIPCTLFYLFTSSRPSESNLIGKSELAYLANKNRLVRESLLLRENTESENDIEMKGKGELPRDKPTPPKKPAPLTAILLNRPVWIFIITKYFIKVIGDLVEKDLPKYLNYAMHQPKNLNGIINASNSIIFSAGCLCAGFTSNFLISRRPFNMNKSQIRKLMQSTASFGCALCLIGAGLSVCYLVPTAVSFGILFALSTFGAGGEAQMPVDLSERYSGTIHAIASSISSTSGILTPMAVGVITKGRTANRYTWRAIWFGASFISFCGGLAFLLFAEAKIQPFDSIRHEDDEKEVKTEKPSDKRDVESAVKNSKEDLTVTADPHEKTSQS